MGHADNKFRIITEVVKILREDQAIAERIGDKIFPIIAPEGTAGDFIVYQRDGLDVETSKMGVALQRSYIYLTVVSEDYDRCLALAELVCNALVGDLRDPEMKIELRDYTEDYVDKKFIQTLLITIL